MGAAATQIHHPGVAEIKTVRHGQRTILRLLLAGKHVKLERQAFKPRKKTGLIRRLTHGAGGNHLEPHEVGGLRVIGVHPQGTHRPVDCGGLEFACCGKTLTEPHGFAHLIGQAIPSAGFVIVDDQTRTARTHVHDADAFHTAVYPVGGKVIWSPRSGFQVRVRGAGET